MPEFANPVAASSPERASFARILGIWFLIGAQSFGGGMATLALIRRAAVERERWVEPEEFARMWALVQVAPGINLLALTILIGRKAGGTAGIVAATIGLMAPSVAITILFTATYHRYEGAPIVRAAMHGVLPAVLALGLTVMAQIAKPMLANRGVGLQLPVVQLPRGKLHDRLVHAVLDRQFARDAGPIVADESLEEAGTKPFGGRLLADNGGRQLAMIAGKHQAVAAQQRDPAARLGALAGLVDDHQVETPRAQQLAVDAGGRGADHGGRVEDALGGL